MKMLKLFNFRLFDMEITLQFQFFMFYVRRINFIKFMRSRLD